MWITADIHAYDVMDQVWITARVRSLEPDRSGPTTLLLEVTTSILGEGETDPRQWLRDVLVGLLEDV